MFWARKSCYTRSNRGVLSVTEPLLQSISQLGLPLPSIQMTVRLRWVSCAEISGAQSLEIENARLRAELAGCYADQVGLITEGSEFRV